MPRRNLKRGAGELNHRLTIQAPVHDGDNGEPDHHYEDVQQVWGSIGPVGGREQLQAGQVQSISNHLIRIRFVPWLTTAHRFSKWDSRREQYRRFNIDRIDEDADGTGTYLDCYVTQWWEAPSNQEPTSA